MGTLKYRRGKVTLNYLDEKPTVYKAMQLHYPQIDFDTLLEEVAHAEGVSKTQATAVVLGVLNRASMFLSIGHPVSMGSFGSFKPVVRSKVAKKLKEATAETVTAKVVRFYPGSMLKEAVANLELCEDEVLSVEE